MAEYVSNTIAQLIADLGNALIGGAAMRAVIAAVLDQGDLGPIGAEDAVTGGIYGAIETIVHDFLRVEDDPKDQLPADRAQ